MKEKYSCFNEEIKNTPPPPSVPSCQGAVSSFLPDSLESDWLRAV